MDVALLLVGGVMLYFGAEWLVGGASRLALSLRIPQLIVGLTVVAYGTSAPEVIVSIQAAAGGHGDVALGNVIGSNIANLGLILGLSVLIRPARVDGALRRRELPLLLASALVLPLILIDGTVQAWESSLLVLAAIAYTAWAVRSARSGAVVAEASAQTAVTAEAADLGGAPAPSGRSRQMMVAFIGLIVLLVGGHVFVSAAASLARSWGMTERIVGLTIVAIGTSLPELATSLIAAMRGHSDIAVGNVVGSNIFNILLCLGAAGMVGSISSSPSLLVLDLGVLILMTLAGLVFMRTARTFRRWEGAVLLASYLVFLTYLLALA
jgi:cation:H+ antiporter